MENLTSIKAGKENKTWNWFWTVFKAENMHV